MVQRIMDKTLSKICGLLKSPDNLRRCGAALVLAELAPKSSDVVKLLGETMKDSNPQLSACVLDALQAIGSSAAVPFVMPLLHSEDMATRMRAVAIVASAGAAVVPEIKAQITSATRQQKLTFIDLLARIHTRETLQMMLDMLFEQDFGLVKETCDAVRRHAAGAPPPERLKLHKQVVQFMNTARVKNLERVMTSSLLLLGHIGRPEAASILLKYSAQKTLPYIRRHALIALKGIAYDAKTSRAVLGKVFPYLDDTDEEMVRHTLEIIGRLPEPGISAAQWRKLLQNPHASVRAFATRKLAELDTPDNNSLLVDLLSHEDNDVREIAAGALAGHTKATPLLLKALASEKNVETANRLARILKPHSGGIDKKTVKKFTALAAKQMLDGKPQSEPLLYFVRNIDPKAVETIFLDTGMEHKRAKRWPDAVNCLRRLIHTETFNDDVSYALSVCDLKASKKELALQVRAEDHSLRGFMSLFRRNSALLLERLKKDRILDASDLYYVGFHFNEGSLDEKAFGEELFRHVAKTWPRSEEAKSIKKRLQSERAASGPDSRKNKGR
jgi:HEAT repeat protein